MSRSLLCLLFIVFSPFMVFALPVDSVRLATIPSSFSIVEHYLMVQQIENSAMGAFLRPSILFSRVENRLCIKEMVDAEIGAVFRYQQNSFSIQSNHWGYSKYGDLKLSASYSRVFGKHISFGFRFNYFLQHSVEYASVHSISFDLSFYAKITRHFSLGFIVNNPAAFKVGITGKSILPIILQVQSNYVIGKNCLLYAAISKEIKSVWNISVGAGYQLKSLVLFIDAEFPRPSIAVGISVYYRRFLFGGCAKYAIPAGFISQLNISYFFKT